MADYSRAERPVFPKEPESSTGTEQSQERVVKRKKVTGLLK